MVDCGRLDDPINGSVTFRFNLTTFNSVATYSCNTGFTLVGNISRICQIDGNWSDTAPICTRK